MPHHSAHHRVFLSLFGATIALVGFFIPLQVAAERSVISLDGTWSLSTGEQTVSVEVPGTFEEQLAIDFDGTATYHRSVSSFPIPDGHRLLLHFDGAATHARVMFNGALIGRHTGAWTPFRCDITDLARESSTWNVRVEVDESVGHHTQGFLPIVAPHFGGLWQSVKLLVVPEAHIEPLRLLAHGNTTENALQLSIPVAGIHDTTTATLTVALLTPDGAVDKSFGSFTLKDHLTQPAASSGETLQVAELNIPWKLAERGPPERWSPDSPTRYPVRITLHTSQGDDAIDVQVAFRDFRVDGERFLLNDSPVQIRGLLNWGYAPPRTAPSLDETWMRNEIELAKSYGFNLMKFCLWVPPRRYLELCDEMGILAWIEYPTWHAQLVPENLPQLEREYREFFAYDRNHPCVVLRSLTCETGPSADVQVIKSLYDLCKREVPGSIVEDDSSWIQWNRVHDFYDDHPYGNNHTWPSTLTRLNDYIAQRTLKPLVLGEAIAADTWTMPSDFARDSTSERPFFWPIHLDDNARWLDMMSIQDSAQLSKASRAYARLMRKYQIEAFRQRVPYGGYVVSVIRDFPLASMGFIDYHGRPKWDATEWSFHGPTTVLMKSTNDRRSFTSQTTDELPFALSHFGASSLAEGAFTVRVMSTDGTIISPEPVQTSRIEAGTLSELGPIAITWPLVSQPTRMVIRAVFNAGDQRYENEWPVWVFPAVDSQESQVAKHASVGHHVLPAKTVRFEPGTREHREDVLITRHLDEDVLDWLREGRSVVMLPDGEAGSFPIANHWFLRGGPVVCDAAASKLPCVRSMQSVQDDRSADDMLVELQHFDFGGPVVPRIDAMLEAATPWLVLWDNHDVATTSTHGLVFELPVFRGRLIVSTLAFEDPTNAAQQWMLQQLIRAAESHAPHNVTQARQVGERLARELNRFELPLHTRSWSFAPDGDERGVTLGWHTPGFDDREWTTIKADRHWDGQGFGDLDGWAWYRLKVELPASLRTAEHVYINFSGVDDHYRLYVNGNFVGSGGDIATKTTAFEERKSFEITDQLDGDGTLHVAIAVYDWYGAGGIFRPVTLSTLPLGGAPPWIK